MKKAIIIYQSRTGITKRFGEEIGQYLISRGLDAKVMPVQESDGEVAGQYEFVFLGCWTAGFMLMFQHPDRHWVRFVKQLPALKDKNIALFTTYKLATGSMFRKMRKHLAEKMTGTPLELKSRNGRMNDNHKQLIDLFVGLK